MRLIFILPEKGPQLQSLRQALAERWAQSEVMRPRMISPLTGLALAMTVQKAEADAVVATNIYDAAAAISAAGLCKNSKYKIIVMPTAGSPVPRGIPTEVAAKVDAWILPTALNAPKWQALLRERADRLHILADTAEKEIEGGSPSRFLWAGPIDSNTQRLIQAIKIVDGEAEPCSLAICGQGAARHTMPAVQASRAMKHPERVTWKGDAFDLQQEAATADAIIQAGPEPTHEELDLAVGKLLLSPQEPANGGANNDNNSIEGFAPSLAVPMTIADQAARILHIASTAPMPLESQAEEIMKIIES